MSIFGKKNDLDSYLKKHPETRVIAVCGTRGRISAINALGMLLGQIYTVTLGVNDEVDAGIILINAHEYEDIDKLQPALTVITGCDNDQDAQLCFALANRSGQVVLNYNDVLQQYASLLQNPEVTTYGDELPADYYFENHEHTVQEGQKGDIVTPQGEHIPVEVKILGEHNLRPLVMAAVVASKFGANREQIVAGISEMRPIHGRMSPAKGMRGSIIIDDSADPEAESIWLGLRAIYDYEAAARMIVIDDAAKLQGLNLELLTDILVLNPNPNPALGGNFHQFTEEIELINYLGSRLEEGGIVLLEIPLPEIIESYMW